MDRSEGLVSSTATETSVEMTIRKKKMPLAFHSLEIKRESGEIFHVQWGEPNLEKWMNGKEENRE